MIEESKNEKLTCIEYVCYEDFDGIGICGEIKIPRGTRCLCINGYIVVDEAPVCVDTSENAHVHFTRDNDGEGLVRGDLIWDIRTKLATLDDKHQARWDEVWDDPICQKYKKEMPFEVSEGIEDTWLWGHDFYIADICDLIYINDLIDL